MATLAFGVLGPLEFRWDDDPHPIPTAMQRRLAAVLLAHVGSPVPADILIAAMWDGSPPPSSRRTLTTYVSRLRSLLGDPARVDTSAGAYTLRLKPSELDATRFREHLAVSTSARQRDDLADARVSLRRALALWRGPAFSGLCDIDLVNDAAQVLEQLRLSAFEDWADLELDAGGHADVLEAIDAMILAHPYRERLRGHLMIALYRSGRRAEALAAYQDVYRLLADELGIDPTPELAELHHRILRGDATLAVPHPTEPHPVAPSGRTFPKTLPADVARFIGRSDALDWLDHADAAGTVVINAVAGTAGVGKTALAVRWSHAAAARFPDGQLFVDLRGHGPGEPMSTMEALSYLLRIAGVTVDRIPDAEQEASALLRSTLAETRCLLVLDNAASAQQVRPLLPGGVGNLVLITSRNSLSGLVALNGARRYTLDMLGEDDAVALLASLIDVRAAVDPLGAAALVQLCGGLPLAIRIAGAYLLDHPSTSIATYLTELRSSDLIAALALPDDPSTNIATVFGFSYANLDAAHQRLFRLLGAAPAIDVDAASAAAIGALPAAEVVEVLDRLVEAHLVIRCGDRYTLHDLIREYARGLDEASGTADGHDAIGRLCRYYRDRASSAATILGPDLTRLPIAIEHDDSAEPFAEPAAAFAWFDAERVNLVATIRRAASAGLAAVTWEFADILRQYFLIRRHMPEWMYVSELAVRTASEAGHLAGEAAARLGYSHALWWLGRRAEAVEVLTPARALAEAASWHAGALTCLGNLGAIYGEWGRHDEAIRCFIALDEALQRHGALPVMAANNASNLSASLHTVGRTAEALHHNRRALEIYTALGVGHGIAIATANLGDKMLFVGDFEVARELLDDALVRFRQLGDQYGEATVLTTMARLDVETGHVENARTLAAAAVDVARQAGARSRIGAALSVLGLAVGDLRLHTEALDYADGDISMTARWLTTRGRTLAALDRYAEAIEACEQAYVTAIGGGSFTQAGIALTCSAEIHLEQGCLQAAHRDARRALEIYRQTSTSYANRAQAVLDALVELRFDPSTAGDGLLSAS